MSATRRISDQNMSLAQLEALSRKTSHFRAIEKDRLAIERGAHKVEENKAQLADEVAQGLLRVKRINQESELRSRAEAQKRDVMLAEATAESIATDAELQAMNLQHKIRALPLNARNAAEQRASQRMSHGWWGENKRHIIALTRWVKPLLIAITLVAFLVLAIAIL